VTRESSESRKEGVVEERAGREDPLFVVVDVEILGTVDDA
jgi:hypothetical protein